MARYKDYDYSQGKFIPIHFDRQILPGTFEYSLHYLIDNEIDLSCFDLRYRNDETGAPAYDPAILLKIILYAYSRGIISSRKIAQCCRENIIFMALSANTEPHFTTIADFISTLDQEIINLFLEVLLICDEMGLIGKEMFAVDGVKLPSNASKEWSGTKKELERKKEGTRENFEAIGNRQDVFEKAKLTADSGFHTEANMKEVMGQNIDAYIADTQFRKRDPRFADVDKYKERFRRERAEYYGTADLYRPHRDFTISEDKTHCICPAGKRLYRNGGNVVVNGQRAIKFHGRKTDCRICELRERCLRHPDRTEARQVYFFQGSAGLKPETFTQKMKRKIDSIRGRLIYNRRLGTAEPPFAHICSILGLDRFTLRGKLKVNTQWLFYCIVHNLTKVHRYGEGFA